MKTEIKSKKFMKSEKMPDLEERLPDVPKTLRELDIGKYKKLMIVRKENRNRQRSTAKTFGHKLGHNNRMCKICGAGKMNYTSTACKDVLAAKAVA